MLDLIEKRHPAEGGWALFTELSNGTGANASGRADAFAIGIWPSRGHEAHCYEIKISREDLKRELLDPRKADTVGKYADYFWLVVSDIKLIETLVIPERWGILAPRGKVLHVHRKAPKQEAKQWSRSFCAAVIRHIRDRHVTKAEYNAVRETVYKEAEQRIRNEMGYAATATERAHKELLALINEFYEKSGIDIRHPWDLGNIAEAVRIVKQARFDARMHQGFERVAEQYEALAKAARDAAKALAPDTARIGEDSSGAESTG